MEVSFYRGTTTTSVKIYVATADLNFSLNSKNSFQVKIPYLATQGSFGETSGLSDISLCFTRNIFSTEKYDINFSLGTKIPTNQSDLSEDGKPLPMYYQTSLGTYDAIAGVSFINRNWLFATGIQHAFNQNENKFLWNTWPDYPSQEYVQKYGRAYELKRGTDIMLRIERNFRFSRVNITLGLLPIYRVNKDEIGTPLSDERFKLDDAQGLAMSAIGTAGYSFNVQSGMRFLYGHKIVQRKENPDGLSRVEVMTLSYYYRF